MSRVQEPPLQAPQSPHLQHPKPQKQNPDPLPRTPTTPTTSVPYSVANSPLPAPYLPSEPGNRTHSLGAPGDYVVDFNGPDNPLHAKNWAVRKKIFTAAMLGFATMTAAFAGSIFSTATRQISEKFAVGSVVATLGTSLYVLGFATGSILLAPFSELKGRRCVAAVFSDVFDNRTRGIVATVFSVMVFSGPFLAPFIGSFIVMDPDLGWRWTQYLPFMGFAAFTMNLLFLSESYRPMILVAKGEGLCRRTTNWGIHGKQEEIEIDFRELLKKNFFQTAQDAGCASVAD
ncbi:hypothetical protein G6011_09855 [Alternaria panax]|uniref:Major facilitator superfamily (MFS) profile domain-containing protein n=1 Tax=Alternaria panax TaxID=48097 RepID=A0AAD4I625_9PLEO|nr:hypothetical protein G6011_09855 [Alternaria panax]